MTGAPASPGLGLEPMRVVIVGHVDHGKSTLVGRLVYDTGSLPDGKLEAIKAMCERRGMPFEWAFLMDAFQSERDQGITIDTAQIWLHSATRDYVIDVTFLATDGSTQLGTGTVFATRVAGGASVNADGTSPSGPNGAGFTCKLTQVDRFATGTVPTP